MSRNSFAGPSRVHWNDWVADGMEFAPLEENNESARGLSSPMSRRGPSHTPPLVALSRWSGPSDITGSCAADRRHQHQPTSETLRVPPN